MKSVCKLLGLVGLTMLIAGGAWAQLPGDVVINEVMYDDTVSGSNDVEWVELHNTTGSLIDLSNWVLNDDPNYPSSGTSEGGLLIPSGTTIAANGYLVISRDALTGITGEVTCTEHDNTWQLGNGGDNLSLWTAVTGGTLIDGSLTLAYPDLSPGNEGTSIEKCDEDSPWSDLAADWHPSTNPYSATGWYRNCTPGAANSICADLTPPVLSYVWVVSLTQVDVRFSEDVDQTTAETESNYSVDNGVGNPLSAVRDGTNLRIVHLTFNTLADNAYNLTVSNVEDLNGNSIVTEAKPFVINSDAASAGDVVISEVMYDDTGSTDIEWVEIYNTTAGTIDISGWLLQDATDYPATSEGVLQVPFGTTIAAGAYKVLAKEATPGIASSVVCTEVYGLFALNNDGDNLALNHAVGGQLIYGSLTELYPDLSAANAGNSVEICLNTLGDDWPTVSWYQADEVFTATDRYRHCTPGTAAHICVIDETPPVISSITVLGAGAIDLLFNEDVEEVSAETEANYVVTPGSIVPATATRDNTNNALVHLTFTPALAVDDYTLTVNDVEDLSGNATVNETEVFEIAPSTGNPGDVVITEVMYDDTASGDIEWVELYNTTANPIDISGWALVDDDSYDPFSGEGALVLPASTTISAGQYLVIGEDPTLPTLITGAVVCTESGNWVLSNTGDNLALFNAVTAGTLIYGSLVGTDIFPDLAGTGEGNSVEVCLGSIGDAWTDLFWYESDTEFSPTGRYRNCTPGSAPHTCADATPPQVVSALVVAPQQVDVLFNEAVDQATAEVAANYSVNNGVGNPLGADLRPDGVTVRLTFSAALAPNDYIVTVTNVEDASGNVIAGNNTAPFSVIDAEAIIFTEIMPNPNVVLDNLGEWFEIYNAEAASVDLSNWTITDDGGGSDVIEGPISIGPGEYFVFCVGGDEMTNGGVPEDFVFVGGATGITLNNTGGDVISLYDSESNLVTQLAYTTAFQWGAGYSAQLKNLSYPVNEDTSWCSATDPWVGSAGDLGTPGEANVCGGPSIPDSLSICDLRAQDGNGISVWDNEHVLVRGVVTYNDSCRRNCYVEDNDCAVLVFGDAARNPMIGHTRHPEFGDSVRIEGTLTRFNGLTEFSGTALVPVSITYVSQVVPGNLETAITSADWLYTLDNCAPEEFESRHVIAEDVTFPLGDGAAAFAGNTNYYFTAGNDSGIFRVNNCDTLVGELIPVGPVHLHGNFGQFDATSPFCGGYQLTTGHFAPFEPTQLDCVEPTSMTIAYDPITHWITIRWQPGLGQVCNCYSIFYADVPDADFPIDFTYIDCVCGVAEYTDIQATNDYRIYVITASEACGN